MRSMLALVSIFWLCVGVFVYHNPRAQELRARQPCHPDCNNWRNDVLNQIFAVRGYQPIIRMIMVNREGEQEAWNGRDLLISRKTYCVYRDEDYDAYIARASARRDGPYFTLNFVNADAATGRPAGMKLIPRRVLAKRTGFILVRRQPESREGYECERMRASRVGDWNAYRVVRVVTVFPPKQPNATSTDAFPDRWTWGI